MAEREKDNYNRLHKLNDELVERRSKLGKLRRKGIAFPNSFRRSHTADILQRMYGEKSRVELETIAVRVSIAGRMMIRRIMGKASFATLQDSGGHIQLYIASGDFPSRFYNEDFKKWDLGDIIGACGILFKTKTGELSLYCKEISLLTKALRPLPEKFHGLINKETCYRQRYLDLIMNNESRQIFKTRSTLIAKIREFMTSLGFMEVETPMMQVLPGGATARPFLTHHNSLDMDMYLRISPELYLKRLVVGGFEQVFEINRSFRNEGLSPRHNPEFTMMEMYMAYSDYRELMKLAENLFRTLVHEIAGTLTTQYGDYNLDFSQPFETITMHDAIRRFCPTAKQVDLSDLSQVQSLATSLGVEVNSRLKVGHLISEIFEKNVETNLIQPTFITGYPVEVSPLARRNDNDPNITDRFELFIAGREIGNGFSELNDPEDQARRFREQVESHAHVEADENTVSYDEDYVAALEHGLPPTAGLGLGIDRIVMILTNKTTIRDVVLFPTLRPSYR